MSSTNPYEATTVEIHKPEHADDRSSTGPSPAICRRCGFIAIIASVAAIVWMAVGGLVTYAPGQTAYEIQNVYLSRMLWFGAGSAILQLVAVGLFLRASRPG